MVGQTERCFDFWAAQRSVVLACRVEQRCQPLQEISRLCHVGVGLEASRQLPNRREDSPAVVLLTTLQVAVAAC